jgi:hypothetical protein
MEEYTLIQGQRLADNRAGHFYGMALRPGEKQIGGPKRVYQDLGT